MPSQMAKPTSCGTSLRRNATFLIVSVTRHVQELPPGKNAKSPSPEPTFSAVRLDEHLSGDDVYRFIFGIEPIKESRCAFPCHRYPADPGFWPSVYFARPAHHPGIQADVIGVGPRVSGDATAATMIGCDMLLPILGRSRYQDRMKSTIYGQRGERTRDRQSAQSRSALG